MKHSSTIFVRTLLILASCLVSCSSTKSAELELAAARAAIDAAENERAAKCAKQIFLAAQSVMREANALAEKGEHDAARAKAEEAERLAGQAKNASPPGCDDPPAPVVRKNPNPDLSASSSSNVGRNIDLTEALETIYFDYNLAHIREDSKTVLSQIAEIMASDGEQTLEIEGHCDARGSTEYNLHLGERRARSVRKYLVTQGVSPRRLEIISYGEERPVDLGETESAHQKNRRAELKSR